MSRRLRIQRAGAWYHVDSRDAQRCPIDLDARDRRHWLELVEEAVAMWRWVLHGYVRELDQRLGGMDYTAVSVAIKRFEKHLQNDRHRARQRAEARRHLLNVET